MTTHPNSRTEAPYWSLPGLTEGAWRTGPLLPGTVIFAMAFGTLAAQKGLSLTDTVLMNALVFAGAAQLVAPVEQRRRAQLAHRTFPARHERGVGRPKRSTIRPAERPPRAIAASALVTSSGMICTRSIPPCAKFSRK